MRAAACSLGHAHVIRFDATVKVSASVAVTSDMEHRATKFTHTRSPALATWRKRAAVSPTSGS